MVSVVLLTTEEILNKNGFWFRLDSLWFAEEMEPFQEVQPGDLFTKPLSKDFYYAKYPELTRSESEEENSLSLQGFQSKHFKWKSKICIRQISTRPKSLDHINTSSVSNCQGYLKRSASLVIRSKPCTNSLDRLRTKCDNSIRKFFNRILQKAELPLREHDEITARNTIYNSVTTLDNFNDIDIPEYAEFENNAILQSANGCLGPTSTLKKLKKRVSFSTESLKNDFDCNESWYDTIYGVTQLITSETSGHNKTQSDGDNVSWSDIISVCGASSLLRRSRESLNSVEELLSYSHHADTKPFDVSLDEDEESGYTKFVVQKIYQTLKIDNGMSDSSPMKDLSVTENSVDKPFDKALYRLAPLEVSVDAMA